MTQEFYAKEVLPGHIEHFQWLQSHYQHEFFFQEDNDPSHGTRSVHNEPQHVKQASEIRSFIHPAQSPDFNPVEGIWLIIKQRLRGRTWFTVAEFKQDSENGPEYSCHRSGEESRKCQNVVLV
jgi:hypothetical protein